MIFVHDIADAVRAPDAKGQYKMPTFYLLELQYNNLDNIGCQLISGEMKIYA